MCLYRHTHDVLYSVMDPKSQLYARSQIAALTSIDASSLNYWSREGILVASAGGGGQGSHRRFDFVQVNIAAIFGQLRRFGLNIGALRSLADVLQAAARLGASYDLHPSNYLTAAQIASALHRFRSGNPVLIPARSLNEARPTDLYGQAYSDWLMAKRPAENEDEVVNHLTGIANEYDPRENVIAAAEGIGPGQETCARIYGDLVYDILAPGYSGGYSWLLALDDDGTWRIAFGEGAKFFDTILSEDPEEFGAGLFLPVAGVIRKVWNLKTPDEHRRERDGEYIRSKLSAAGITATVTISADEDENFSIEAPEAKEGAIEAALSGTRFAIRSKA